MSEFAKRQLKKHGWTEGCGLGKQENGRSEPIKVSLKMDKTGVGHDPGKEFTDHWWLRVFNEAAQKIGKKQQDPASHEEDKLEQKKGAECKNSLYKNFVKSSTLTNGIEEKNGHSDSSSEDSSDGEHDTSVPTLNDIHKFCGGATGHKAARFGIKMGGKLARIAQHDKMFEERLEKEKLTVDMSTSGSCKNNILPETVEEKSFLLNSGSDSNKQIPCETVDGKRKNKKHKKEKHSKNEEGSGLPEALTDDHSDVVNDEVSETVNNTKKHKKKKHKETQNHVDDSNSELSKSNEKVNEDIVNDEVSETVNNKKKKHKENHVDDSNSELSKSNEKEHRAKNKKKRKHVSVDNECAVFENNVADMNKSHKKITEEEVSSNELDNESRSEKKRRLKNNIAEINKSHKKISEVVISSNEFDNESRSEKKRRLKNNIAEINKSHKKVTEEEEVSSNELDNKPRSEKKRRLKNNIVNEVLDESVSKRKDISEEIISSDMLLDESRSKRRTRRLNRR